ncbi:alanine racemase [Rummeliibacillus sp. NPDC094406]|uniref:alanine racemase n=1 Tax=Rummeliibacillus sp. NPDC094406 TaxID=3364511 RepID=UPI0037FF8386
MNELLQFRPTKAIIDLSAIRYNIENLRKHLQSSVEIIAVVKANAYGHGDVQVAKAALEAGATMLAVATPEEALHLRTSIDKTPILILGAVPVNFAPFAAKADITLTVFSPDWINEVAFTSKELSNPLKVHIKVDSGMGRIGVRTEKELKAVYDAITMANNIEVDGIFTHFATADEEDTSKYDHQLEVFKGLVASLPVRPRLVHAANTAASLVKEDVQFDAVRFGISMYGLAPSTFVEKRLPYALHPALALESELVHVKKVAKGDTVSYGGTYVAQQDEWIGTMPIGYADGVIRGLSGQEVLIDGTRAPIIGRICMDQCMVRLPREMAVGEKVVLIGKQQQDEIHIQEWANRLHTIVYEIPCMLSQRVPKIYK